MKDIIISGLKVLVVFLIAIVIINDAGAIAMTRIGSGDMAQVVADTAVSSYKASHSPMEAQSSAESVAKQRGLELTEFYLDKKTITVEIEVPPRRTFIIHRIKSLKPYLSATVTATANIE